MIFRIVEYFHGGNLTKSRRIGANKRGPPRGNHCLSVIFPLQRAKRLSMNRAPASTYEKSPSDTCIQCIYYEAVWNGMSEINVLFISRASSREREVPQVCVRSRSFLRQVEMSWNNLFKTYSKTAMNLWLKKVKPDYAKKKREKERKRRKKAFEKHT